MNGLRGTLTEIDCRPQTAVTTYVCSGRLSLPPGTYELRLSTSFGGMESERSPPLVVIVLSAAASLEAGGRTSAIAEQDSLCLDTTPPGCFDVRVVAQDVGAVTALASTGDGRLLFVEDERRIRIVENGVLAAEPALVVEESGARLAGLAVDHAFSETRAVFVAIAEPRAESLYELRIVRYREIGGLLGQGGTIAAALPMTETGRAPLAVDSNGLVYVALPAVDRQDSSRPIHAGRVLRFTRDGATPTSNAIPVPTIATGVRAPRALLLDGLHKRLWLTGDVGGGGGSIASLPLDTSERQVFSPPPAAGRLTTLAARASTDNLAVAALAGASVFARFGTITAAAQTASGLFLAVANAERTHQIIELAPQRK